jgi:hypothetical protein
VANATWNVRAIDGSVSLTTVITVNAICKRSEFVT